MSELASYLDARCPVCQGEELDPVVKIEGVPAFCNVQFTTRREALNTSRGDIDLTFCNTCGHLFNQAFDPARMDYTQSYENSLHFSSRFQEYALTLAEHLIEKHGLRKKNIIEIGCGKGEFLGLLCDLGGNRGLGFDPSYQEDRSGSETTNRLFRIIRDVYTDQYADYTADLIACRHVLEHIAQPRAFLNTIRLAIADSPKTVVFFEVPNAMHMVREIGVWDVIYEHCGYFSRPSLAHLFADFALVPIAIDEAFAGQYLCLEAVPEDDHATESPVSTPDELAAIRHQVRRFSAMHHQKVADWEERLDELARAGQRVVIWGGGSKGVTFLNSITAAASIDYVVDINPHKHGMHVPGTGQQIVTPDFLVDHSPDTILVMNPIYEREIGALAADLDIDAEICPI